METQRQSNQREIKSFEETNRLLSLQSLIIQNYLPQLDITIIATRGQELIVLGMPRYAVDVFTVCTVLSADKVEAGAVLTDVDLASFPEDSDGVVAAGSGDEIIVAVGPRYVVDCSAVVTAEVAHALPHGRIVWDGKSLPDA